MKLSATCTFSFLFYCPIWQPDLLPENIRQWLHASVQRRRVIKSIRVNLSMKCTRGHSYNRTSVLWTHKISFTISLYILADKVIIKSKNINILFAYFCILWMPIEKYSYSPTLPVLSRPEVKYLTWSGLVRLSYIIVRHFLRWWSW